MQKFNQYNMLYCMYCTTYIILQRAINVSRDAVVTVVIREVWAVEEGEAAVVVPALRVTVLGPVLAVGSVDAERVAVHGVVDLLYVGEEGADAFSRSVAFHGRLLLRVKSKIRTGIYFCENESDKIDFGLT